MITSRQEWKTIYNLFNHTRRLEAEDMDLFVERPGDAAKNIESQLEMEPQAKWLLCGSIGSGKSSELVRLYDLLKDQYAVIGLDLFSSASRVERLTPAEVLFLIGASIVRTAAEVWGEKIDARLEKNLKDAFSNVLATRTINVSDLLQGVALFAVSVAGMATGAFAFVPSTAG